MKIYFHGDFKKKFKKLREAEKKRFQERSILFIQNPFHPIFHNHELVGQYRGYRSINITGDLRVLYEPVGKEAALFVTIDTHSNLYK